MIRRILLAALVTALGPFGGAALGHPHPEESDFRWTAPRNLLLDHPARNADGTVNAVVEIPAGTTAKWETAKSGAELRWEFKNGRPRVVKYLAYPGSYGMIPRTLLPAELGGDGDPLDVLVLGNRLARGDVVAVKLVAVLRLLDEGERDDKLVAVQPGSTLGKVDDLAELDEKYPGVTTIVATWFGNYKGPGKIQVQGWGDAADARAILKSASDAFEKAQRRAD